MNKTCPTCKQPYAVREDEGWKKQCYDCYKNFRGKPHIWGQGEGTESRGVIIFSHPDATKEEINEYIKKKWGSVNDPSNWGAVEMTGKNVKVWWNCQNDD